MIKEVINSSRFGLIDYELQDVVVFNEGLVGLPSLKQFVLIQHKENSPFRWMQSLEEGAVAFLVVDTAAYVEG